MTAGRVLWYLFLTVSTLTWCALALYGGEWLLGAHPRLFVGLALTLFGFLPFGIWIVRGVLTGEWGVE